MSRQNSNGTFRYWSLTIPHEDFVPYLPPGVKWIRGQLESGGTTGYLHWQLCLALDRSQRRTWLSKCFGSRAHVEPSRSEAIDAYVWKEDTRVPDTQFELGRKPVARSTTKDWDAILAGAKTGDYESIPSDVMLRYYGAITRITKDFLVPVGIEREVFVFWGKTGTGKSRRAWMEAGFDAYPKCPNSKFWDGYRGHEHVVMDEFRGTISISHMLRWLDRYPVNVEVKGSAVVLKAKKIWITSNLDPRLWYPQEDQETQNALLRRLNITHYDTYY